MSLSDIEKAAVLLIALGPARAQRILDQLGADELLPLIQAMERMRQVDPEIRRAVLEEVNQILTDLVAGQTPHKKTTDQTGESKVNLFERLGPYLSEQIDPNEIDWDAAGPGANPPNQDPPTPEDRP